MGKIKLYIKNNPLTSKLYAKLKNYKDMKIYESHFDYSGKYYDRSKGREKLCIILAGYKEYLFGDVFSRIIKYKPEDIDVCIVSSGKHSDILKNLCETHDWSYLSTEENNVSLVQNIAIRMHPKARYIYKLDEDIFICESFFERMIQAFLHAKGGDYNPGVIAPLLLINGYASLRILRKTNLINEYESRFGPIKHAAGIEQQIESNDKVARFMWGEDNVVPSIDVLNRKLGRDPIDEKPCPIRFSIGAILFERSLWEEMGFFDVERNDKAMMGKDEVKLCSYCLLESRPLMVSENIVVGHFSFGNQTEGMKRFYTEHPEKFQISE